MAHLSRVTSEVCLVAFGLAGAILLWFHNPWGRVILTIAVICLARWLVTLPLLGQAIPVFILYILWNEKSSIVLTERYWELVVPATPHIRSGLSRLLWLLICLVVVLLVVSISYPFLRHVLD